jgi:phosphoglucosamine mutase
VKTLIKNRHKLFGTDGIRGTPGVYPLTKEMLITIAGALSQHILNNPELKTTSRPRVVIGKDTRISGADIEKILSDSIRTFGIDVLLTGIITTPGLSYFVKDLKADVGIMISASHNKASDNGIKFFNSKGQKFSESIEEDVEDIIFTDIVLKPKHTSNKHTGRLIKVKDAQVKYAKFLKATVNNLNLKGLTVALDCAWGAAAPFGKKVFSDLGAKVAAIHDKPSGHNINEGGAINPSILKKLVLDSKADIGIAVDGDGDRGILIDEKGQIVDGDCTIAIIARFLADNKKLPKNTVVGTVMSNFGLKVSLEEMGINIICTDVGDKYVLEALLNNELSLGGEQSGHIIFLNYLCTPDGLLTALQMLRVMKETQKSLSELCKCMTKYPQILVNIKVKEKMPFDQMLSMNTKLREYNERLKDQGRILLRYSGTELLARVMVEGKDKNTIEEIAHSLASQIQQEIGV